MWQVEIESLSSPELDHCLQSTQRALTKGTSQVQIHLLPALDSDSQVQTLLLQCLESFHTLAYMQYKTPKLLETHLFPHSQAHEVLQGAFFKLSFAVKTDNIYQQQWSTKALKSTHSLLP